MPKILAVDDNEQILWMLEKVVQNYFPTVSELQVVRSGNQAINTLRKNSNFDLIISDFEMPDGNGLDVLKFLDKEHAHIPIIIYTDSVHVSQESVENEISKKVRAYVVDKCDLDALRSHIDSILTKTPD